MKSLKLNYFKLFSRNFCNFKSVPLNIPRPEYALTGEPLRTNGSVNK